MGKEEQFASENHPEVKYFLDTRHNKKYYVGA
jgi:hypothetical protein